MEADLDTLESSILVVGGGVAGIAAALDLANSGLGVHLIEQNHRLGGQVTKLDKLYPTDHCAFCPLWTEIKRCMEHPLITVHRSSHLKALEKDGSHYVSIVIEGPSYIDGERCVFCGQCEKICPVGAIATAAIHSYPPSYSIDTRVCTRCASCQDVCPSSAIDLSRTEKETILRVDDVIWATGFREADISHLEEFGLHGHPDIMSAMEFEEWIAEAGPQQGKTRKRSDLSTPHSIAFVQCAGARDMRALPHCSAVCCMHALKQARWVRMRNPRIRCVIFYTDLRAVGRHYHEYAQRAIEEADLELIRGRPALILPLAGGEGIAIKYEDTMMRKIEIRRFDIVVLNGALEPCLGAMPPGGDLTPSLDCQGFIDNESDEALNLACGFIREPADVMESVIQASSTALKAAIHIRQRR